MDDRGLIGRGRACDVHADGPGRVRRHYRDHQPGRTSTEFAVMRHVAAHGFPVPEVFEYDDDDLVMERIDGRTMMDRLGTAPWQLRSLAALLADLHRRLARVPVDGLVLPRLFDVSGNVLHLDLHPDNVMLASRGPVVIDWTNACLGPASIDVATTWVVMATSEIDAPRRIAPLADRVRRSFVERFVDLAGRDAARAVLVAAGERRLADRNVRPSEADRVRRLLAQQAPGPVGAAHPPA